MGNQSHNNSPTLLGQAVRSIREALSMTQETLAARSGLHRTYVAGVERGVRNPSLRSIAKLADGLGLPISDLFRRMESISKAKVGGRTRPPKP